MTTYAVRLLNLGYPAVLLLLHLTFYGLTWSLVPLAVLGFIVWTLLEYVLHRLAHVVPCLQMDHWLHHEHPLVPSGPSELVTAGIIAGVLTGTVTLLGGYVATALNVGLLFGFAMFSIVHFMVHHVTIEPDTWELYKAKLAHTAHHRVGDVNYGVLTDWWDRVFGTAK